ncbi:MAG: hypothetical protein COZ06_35745 [Armatimonadetes bacterium CG_4_10_14_3_um_filter_66_18]|nr:hypothetical protein [Armatimonadota bacterium]NCO90328.1 hypothetical protein [Armatimonadota bacterium]OIP05462.1 MAG: hypothetical protein AUJ96_10815 [Armatimonadetes bacterium CG2_30_66_41]PIU92976.1 MAG: hypothetical protein COS65_15185 [Armatimonadetes bacterium CG06_land_8_20_14_3_00_66_21]PIY36590.1 MAG: hypothetical protein COZ06_35745 [Armatimonadetes bacterium CG_4_10_14_3_um_filter_66_18]
MAQATAEVIYSKVVKPLPASERFKLAALILEQISPRGVVDYSEEWTEEDMREATLHSFRRAARSFGEEDWAAAGLHYASAYRSYLLTLDDGSLPTIGRLSDRDWGEVQACLRRAVAVT